MQFLRKLCIAERVTDNSKLKRVKNGASVSVAGVVLVRQWPGSAKGVVFITLDDEIAPYDVVVWPQALEQFRVIVMGSRLMLIWGRVQRTKDIIHVFVNCIEDRTSWLTLLTEEHSLLKNPLARADEVVRPGSDQRQPSVRHPRNVRVIPRSRDFH